MNNPEAILTNTSVSSYEIILDKEIVNYLITNGWTTTPKKTAQGMFFYNRTSNAAFVVKSEGTSCTRLALISLAHPDNMNLVNPIPTSSIGSARNFFRKYTQEFADYDPFTQQNDTTILREH